MVSRQSAIVWSGILILLCSISTYHILTHWRLQTDVLALLPAPAHDPMVQTIRRMVSGELGRTALFLVSHVQLQTARHATRQLGQWMDASSLFSVVRWDYSNQPKLFFEFYFPLRYRVVASTIRSYFDKENSYQYLIDHLRSELYQPMGYLTTRFLEADPLLFFPELIKDFGKNIGEINHFTDMNGFYQKKRHAGNVESAREQVAPGMTFEDGMMGTIYHGRRYYFIIAQLASNPFEERTQAELEENWQAWSRELQQSYPGLELSYTGVARHASSMRKRMQSDIYFISIGSTVGITLLIIIVFRSLKQLVIALIPLALGCWIALGVSLMIFGELHAFTLTFGSSLIGVCIDYSMYYFAHHRVSRHWESMTTMRHILPAITLGALTTLLSYIGLGLTPLVGLQQMAVFASCGISVSFFTVVFWFPFLLRHAHPMASDIPLLHRGLQYGLRFLVHQKKPLIIVLIIVTALCMTGFFTLRVSDSPLVLKTLTSDVAEQDRIVQDIFRLSEAGRYLIVEGKNAEEALQRLENFQDYLQAHGKEHSIEVGPVITSFLPSQKRQEDNVRALKRLIPYKKEISEEMESLGLPNRSIENFFLDLESEPGIFLVPDMWLNHDVSLGLRHFWLNQTADSVSIVVRLQTVADLRGIEAVMSPFEGIRIFDYMEEFTRMFESYRRNITRLVGAAYMLVCALLIWRYGLRGFAVMLPPLLAAAITVGILGLMGQTFHLLHFLALLLILGMGVDYAIFMAESDSPSESTTLMALTLAAATTILSFGLLSFSSQAALKAIGFSTFLGIFCAWLLSPLAMYGRRA